MPALVNQAVLKTTTALSSPRVAEPEPRPARRIRWDYLIPIAVIHLIALLVCVPWLFSWTGLILFQLCISPIGQLGVPIGYHRLLTHRSFRVPKWLERTFVTIALCSAQNTPARWVCWHRMHHQHSDQPGDPHSPLVTFFWAHVGWLLVDDHATHSAASYYKYSRDILDDPYYLYLEKHRWAGNGIYLAHAAAFLLAGLVCGWVSGGWLAGVQLGLSLLVWSVAARTVWMWHVTWAVNSLTHLCGYRNYETRDDSRNNWFVAIIAGGEGWHNNHHHDPTCATVQHRWWEFDLNYYIIQVFVWCGLATHVVPRRITKSEGVELAPVTKAA